MGAPCINDTCSISSRIDPISRRLEHSVNIAAAGGLTCVDGQGLAVEILGDPAAASAIDTAFQQLGISPAGELWSIPKRAHFEDFGSTDPVPIPHNGSLSANPIDSNGSIENPYASPAVIILLPRLRVGYTVVDPGDDDATLETGFGINWVPYSGQLTGRVLVDGNPETAVLFDIGGVHPRASAPHHKRRWEYTAWASIIGAGATMVITADAAFQGDGSDTRYNIDTATADE